VDEFGLIDTFVSQFDVKPPPRGPGDDCAVISSEGLTCVTTDAVVEGVHFTRKFALEDVGHKALAVNLSDLAAMGARPSWFTVALGLPRDFPIKEVKQLGAGMSALARVHGAELVGGNVTRCPVLTITITINGELDGQPMLRSGAREGDAIYVSGPLGNAAAGLAGAKKLISAQRRPSPHVAFGQAARELSSGCIDVSDGLAQDLGHICVASGVGAELDSAAIPLSDALLDFAGSRAKALRYALTGGEDYVLLLTVPNPLEFEAAMSEFSFHRIGTVRSGTGVKLDGKLMRGKLGFKHR
jgi:thiamine-monophosphate kinase